MIQLKSTVDVKMIQRMGDDRYVAAAAWVSTSAEDGLKRAVESPEDVPGVIKYLVKHRHGCYDDETEVLTKTGWKCWPDVDGQESFVTLDLRTNQIVYQSATNVVHKPVKGPMIRMRMNHVDVLVTPDHRMVSSPRRHDRGDRYGLHPARDFLTRSHRLRLGGGEWTEGSLHAPEDVAVVGFVAADGCVNGSTTEFHLRRQRKIDWLRVHAEVKQTGEDRYTLVDPSGPLRRWTKQTYCEDRSRRFPREIMEDGDVETLQALLDGYLVGDGAISDTGKVTCSSVSHQMVDDIQEVAMKIGLAAVEVTPDTERSGAYGTKPLYRVTIYRSRNMRPKIGWTTERREQEVQVVEYEGNVHCVTVPNGTLYVRRNGKPMWCGNTPFEHGSMTLYVHAPIFVWREWHRHRVGFSYNEESARYKTLEPVFYVPDRERPMMKVEGWRPGRPKFTRCEDDFKYERLCLRLRSRYQECYDSYLLNLADGFDPGLARDCLPLGIYSGCWVTCNPRSLMNFLSLRVHEPEAAYPSYPLWEIELAARAAESIFAEGWPITHAAFVANGRVSP